MSKSDAPIGFLYRTDNNGALTDQTDPTMLIRIGLQAALTSVPRQWPNGGYGSERVPARCLFLPYWLLVVTFAIAPAGYVLDLNRRRLRARRGLCSKCGYDLRESQERCPECGTAVVRGANPTAVC